MSAAPVRPLQLLLVDDDPGDVALICETLTRHAARIEVHTAVDGNAYVTKPLDLDELDHAVNDIYAFYGELAVRASARLDPGTSSRPTD